MQLPNLPELRRTIMIFAMLMAALLTAGLRADEARPTCEDVLAACDEHVTALEEEQAQMQKLIEEQTKRISKLEAEVKPTQWYWYVLGGAAAAIVINEVR